MTALRFALMIAVAALTASGQQNSPQPSPPQKDSIPASCPVTTRPVRPFIPPPEYRRTELPEHAFFIGTSDLFTILHEAMIWYWKPHSSGMILTEKIFWYRQGYRWEQEPTPKIKVRGRRIDGPAPPLELPYGRPTHAIFSPDFSAMLTGVYVPVPGCWEITGDYEGNKVSFVVWVEAAKPEKP
ncbi:MAG TPA: hypothetical protein VF532_15160 [Candidatus Angelobacter sp.]